MCGIAGIVHTDGAPVPAAVLRRMSRALAHRGPDGEGECVSGGIGLAHRRLAIIDRDTGAQPMHHGPLTIVFNGEIYNYVELRDELLRRGRQFRTRSDTEVILQLVDEFGDDAVRRLNGMFAFALVDHRRRRLLLARDHFGIKPLYLHESPGRLLFASEIKALLAHPGVEVRPDIEGVRDYLTFQYVQGEDTMFAGIRALPPGSLRVVPLDGGPARTRRYWELDFRVDPGLDEARAVERLDALLQDAVRLQLRSDVPVGAYLSGGTDSSLITALAAPLLAAPMDTFTGRFDEGPEFDESAHARAVAERYGTRLHVITPTEADFIDAMPRLVYHMDEPVAGPGLFPQYMVSAEAARHVKVVLGGQGGDEIFGGYVRYLVAYLEQALKGAIFETNDEGEHIVSLGSIVPNLPALRQYGPMLQAFWRDGLFGPMDARYFRLVDRSAGARHLLGAEFRSDGCAQTRFERFRAVFNHPQTLSYVNKMTHYDLLTHLPALLQVEDRVTMAHGLESRVPLLDPRIAELVAGMPPALKFRGGELKHVLRRVIGDRLPASVLQRKDKMGFPVPLHLWARGRSRDFFADVLLSRRARDRGITDPAEVERLIGAESAFGRGLWGLLNLELWHRSFFDADGALPGLRADHPSDSLPTASSAETIAPCH
jgi:asparagine synthase (glutamine-hydrolysing)